MLVLMSRFLSLYSLPILRTILQPHRSVGDPVRSISQTPGRPRPRHPAILQISPRADPGRTTARQGSFEFVNAAFNELDARSSDEIFHRAGDEDFVWIRMRGYACPGVHGDSSDLRSAISHSPVCRDRGAPKWSAAPEAASRRVCEAASLDRGWEMLFGSRFRQVDVFGSRLEHPARAKARLLGRGVAKCSAVLVRETCSKPTWSARSRLSTVRDRCDRALLRGVSGKGRSARVAARPRTATQPAHRAREDCEAAVR